MPKPSLLANQIEAAIAGDARFKIHETGHSDYLLRYRTATGVPFAIGRVAAGGARVWFSADERARAALEALGLECTRSIPMPPAEGKRATGRNSNLDQIPEFKGAPLYWTRVTRPGEAVAVASKIGRP